MSDTDQNRENPQPVAGPDAGSNLLESLGGEPLEGSGFEHETAEPDCEWRVPR